jgi:hypothetical protein
MKLAALTRIIAFILLAGVFVTDYMFNMWAKEVPREAYLLIMAIALGVDVEFLRGILVNTLSRTLGIEGKDKPTDG